MGSQQVGRQEQKTVSQKNTQLREKVYSTDFLSSITEAQEQYHRI